MVRGVVRAGLGMSAAVCVVATALAQTESHHPQAPNIAQSSEPAPDIRYGAEQIPPERLQKPPTPKLPGESDGKSGGPTPGGPPTPKPPGDPSPPGKPGGPPTPKPP